MAVKGHSHGYICIADYTACVEEKLQFVICNRGTFSKLLHCFYKHFSHIILSLEILLIYYNLLYYILHILLYIIIMLHTI